MFSSARLPASLYAGLGESPAELGVGAEAQLDDEGLGLVERRGGRIEIARQMFNSRLLAQQLAELRLVNATKLGFALREERAGLVEGALPGAKEGEGAPEGAGADKKGLVADRDGISKVALGGEQIALG